MVLGVCRRALGHAQDAEDAFQATFLVLARKAASVRHRGALGNWLYGVAHRTALQARRSEIRRRAKEANAMPRPDTTVDSWDGLREVLDLELGRLPDKFRSPVVLCDLEGRSRKEAARQLGLSETTLASRLATARRMLAQRLGKHGLALSGGALAAALAQRASAALSMGLVSSTVRAAVFCATNAVAASTPATILMKEVMKAMLLTKLKFALASVMAAVMLGAGALVYQAAGQSEGTGEKRSQARPLTELEILRREVQILKLQMEVMQAELHTLKGRAQGANSSSGAGQQPEDPLGPGSMRPGQGGRFSGASVEMRGGPAGRQAPKDPRSPGNKAVPEQSGNDPVGSDQGKYQNRDDFFRPSAGNVGPGGAGFARGGGAASSNRRPGQGASVEEEVDAALKAFKEAHDNEEKDRAAAALEKALRKLREQLRPRGPGNPFGN
jgi:RNA polymerase sigma factor (sigma-70 family)